MIRSAVVIGGGTMGAGIAHVLLVAGVAVTVAEVDARRAAAAREAIIESLSGAVRRGKLTGEQRAAAAALLSTTPTESTEPAVAVESFVAVESVVAAGSVEPVESAVAMEDMEDTVGALPRDAELVVEAVPERLELKRPVLAAAAAACPSAVLASNTSSLSIGSLAAGLAEPGRLLGMHFFNPVPAQELVEIVVHDGTSEAALQTCRSVVDGLGKTAIVVRDSPGFATSRLGVAVGLEAIRMLAEGVASAEDIDTGMRLGYRWPMGPLRLTDLVGLDVRLAIAEHLERELGPRFTPPQLLRDKVARGELGRKSGKGFYEWS